MAVVAMVLAVLAIMVVLMAVVMVAMGEAALMMAVVAVDICEDLLYSKCNSKCCPHETDTISTPSLKMKK